METIMRHILFLLLFSSSLFCQEWVTLLQLQKNVATLLMSGLEYGYGESKLSFAENKNNISYTITSYTLVNEHQRLPGSSFIYNYKLGISHSKTQQKYNALHFDFGLGYDIVKVSKNEYISLSFLTGFNTLETFSQKIELYKAGARIALSKQFLQLPLYIYANANYTLDFYHRGAYEGSGIYDEEKIGLRLAPQTFTNFLFYMGVHYTKIDAKTTKIESSMNYFGLSYLF